VNARSGLQVLPSRVDLSVVSRNLCSDERMRSVNVSAVGSNPSIHPAPGAQKSSAASTAAAQRPTTAPVDADGDHDGDTAVGDRLDVRG
jgi:hypothetical protein